MGGIPLGSACAQQKVCFTRKKRGLNPNDRKKSRQTENPENSQLKPRISLQPTLDLISYQSTHTVGMCVMIVDVSKPLVDLQSCSVGNKV